MIHPLPQRQIRALHNGQSLRVYQAYSRDIGERMLAQNSLLVPGFSTTRMTWIKPSFLWMMYRCGWGYKDAGQACILAFDIARSGFEWALEHACLSHQPVGLNQQEWEALKETCPVRVQWDPERNLYGEALGWRSIQIGLSSDAVTRYAQEWILAITDVTALAKQIHTLRQAGHLDQANALLPQESPLTLSRPFPAILE